MSNVPPEIECADDITADAWRRMTNAQKFAIVSERNLIDRERWMRELRAKHPSATKEEFRQIVIDKLLAESEGERQISARRQRRSEERERPEPPTG